MLAVELDKVGLTYISIHMDEGSDALDLGLPLSNIRKLEKVGLQ